MLSGTDSRLLKAELAAGVCRVAEGHALRGDDAVHVASALTLGDPTVVVAG